MTKSGSSKSEADPTGKELNIFILILHAYSGSKQLCNYFAEVGTKPGKLLQRRNTLEPAKLKVFTVSLTLDGWQQRRSVLIDWRPFAVFHSLWRHGVHGLQ